MRPLPCGQDITTLKLGESATADADAGTATAGDFQRTTHARFACPLTGVWRCACLASTPHYFKVSFRVPRVLKVVV